jgi:serine phosphatase RsbU (regulator of sigma subunit)
MQKRGNIEFSNKDFYLNKGDIMWMSTDGIIDQNNAERKRFGTPKLVETLEDAKELDLKDQKMLLENELTDHQGDEEQRDDITIWGIKFSDKW